MRSHRLSLWCLLAGATLLLTAAGPVPPSDSAQNEFDRFVDIIANGMWTNGRVTLVSAKPGGSDETLIAAALAQLNKRPAPLKEWHILKKQYVGPTEFQAHLLKKYPELYKDSGGVSVSFRGERSTFLIAVIDSNQGHKVIAIAGINSIPSVHDEAGTHWARMYNCDENFSSPQEGGTPLIRTDIPGK